MEKPTILLRDAAASTCLNRQVSFTRQDFFVTFLYQLTKK